MIAKSKHVSFSIVFKVISVLFGKKCLDISPHNYYSWYKAIKKNLLKLKKIKDKEEEEKTLGEHSLSRKDG